MMHFIVRISADLPYPKEFEYREHATNLGVAVNRAHKQFRKEVGRKKVKQLRINVVRL